MWIRPRKFRHRGGVNRQNNLQTQSQSDQRTQVKVSFLLTEDSHAAELQAVGVRLVMGGQVIVVENPNAEHGGVNTGTQEEDRDEACHLLDRRVNTNQLDRLGRSFE